MLDPLSTETVRYHATNETVDSSRSVRQREFAFDAWLAQVKKDAVAEGRAAALEEVIAEVATSTQKMKRAGLGSLTRYEEGKNAGLVTAYNIAYDLKNTTPS